ncbi:hypothetical protein AM571_CH00627 [Rhizobium etli 8C-3]|uniref:Uncharacterized protein n=1 Tax=Rhizobium etli 8C-3 TaxID=538025 RepID=A0A1L5NZY1_RHIET|nr:hypothetical protein AM571_CH00627 [Rhizobium etli 8C-3]
MPPSTLLPAVINGGGAFPSHGFPQRAELAGGGDLRGIDLIAGGEHGDRAFPDVHDRRDVLRVGRITGMGAAKEGIVNGDGSQGAVRIGSGFLLEGAGMSRRRPESLLPEKRGNGWV